MGYVQIVTSSVAAVSAVVFGLTREPEPVSVEANVSTVSVVKAEIGQPEVLSIDQTGSALAAAAFGMSALQPETYNGDLAASIIAASHLQEIEKLHLSQLLAAAEAGRADLGAVLTDVRVALSLE